jgi:hypothetical protein
MDMKNISDVSTISCFPRIRQGSVNYLSTTMPTQMPTNLTCSPTQKNIVQHATIINNPSHSLLCSFLLVFLARCLVPCNCQSKSYYLTAPHSSVAQHDLFCRTIRNLSTLVLGEFFYAPILDH